MKRILKLKWELIACVKSTSDGYFTEFYESLSFRDPQRTLKHTVEHSAGFCNPRASVNGGEQEKKRK